MMQVTPITGSTVRYLTGNAREDYFFTGGNPLGRFFGGAVAELFRTAEHTVQRDELRRLLRGFHPLDPDEALVQHQEGKKHQRGIELCFSDPKSVDTLWSQSNQATRQAIQEERREALKKILSYAEDSFGRTRRGKDGNEIESAKLIFAIFDHYQSRAGDPKLHSHVLLANVGVRNDGTTGTIITKPFYVYQKVLGALYRAELAARLEKRLGVRCELDKTGYAFTFKGHSTELDAHFSKQSKKIEAELRTHGSPAAREAAAREVRPPKNERPLTEKLSEWKTIGRETFRYDPTKVMGHAPRRLSEDLRYEQAFQAAIKHLGRSNSHFTQRELMEHVAIKAQRKGIGADLILKRFEDSLQRSKELVRLGELKGDIRYTTQTVLKLEQKLIRSTDALGTLRHGVRHGIIKQVLRKHEKPRSVLAGELVHHATQLAKAFRKEPTEPLRRDELERTSQWVPDAEQRQAIRHLTQKGCGIRVVEGWAGTGKTGLLRLASEVWTRGGYEVIGVSTSGKAADELQRGAGISSYTIAALRLKMKPSLLLQAKDHARQIPAAIMNRGVAPAATPRLKFTKKTVLVVDEVSMVETRDLAFLIRSVQKAKGMVVLAGDRRQLPAIGLGGGGSFIADRIGKAELSIIRRQTQERDRETVKDLGSGNAQKALLDLNERGKLHIARDWDDAKRKMVSDWTERERGNRAGAQIYVATNEDRVDINERCQAARLQAGELSGRAAQSENGILYKGDRVIFRQPSRTVGVRNGFMGTISSFMPTGIAPIARVKLDSGETVLVPLASYKGLHPGYAITANVGQGSTITNGYALLGGLSLAREMAYVLGSRHRLNLWVYTDKYEAGKDLERLSNLMSRSKEKTLAHAVIRDAQREQQQENKTGNRDRAGSTISH